MSTTDLPNGFIQHQSFTSPPIPVDTTLVDDTVALVDDPVALVGSQTTIIEGFKPKAEILVPLPRVKISR